MSALSNANPQKKANIIMMKKAASLSVAVAVLALAQAGRAQTNTSLLPVSFNAVCTSTNSGTNGTGLLQERVSNINLIDDCAVEHNLTNLTGLSLVFNVTNFSLQVLGTNGTPLCTSLAFTGGLTFTNTNNMTMSGSNMTRIVFQKDVLVETNLTASGVISGTASWSGTNQSSFKLSATLLYTEPASGTNSAEICRAVLRVGQDEDEDEAGGGVHPNNGNHFGWQNPHNPHSH